MPNAREETYVGRCGICEEPLYEEDNIVIVDGEQCHRECAEAEEYEEFE